MATRQLYRPKKPIVNLQTIKSFRNKKIDGTQINARRGGHAD